MSRCELNMYLKSLSTQGQPFVSLPHFQQLWSQVRKMLISHGWLTETQRIKKDGKKGWRLSLEYSWGQTGKKRGRCLSSTTTRPLLTRTLDMLTCSTFAASAVCWSSQSGKNGLLPHWPCARAYRWSLAQIVSVQRANREMLRPRNFTCSISWTLMEEKRGFLWQEKQGIDKVVWVAGMK